MPQVRRVAGFATAFGDEWWEAPGDGPRGRDEAFHHQPRTARTRPLVLALDTPERAGAMMRLWMTSYARPEHHARFAALSGVAHVAVIAAWILGTLPVDSLPTSALRNRLYYIPPPDKPIPPD